MKHQLVSETELKKFCIYCSTEISVDKWGSAWDFEKHYKSATCPCCKKTLHLKVNFEGSGHDSWSGKKFEPACHKITIEDKITRIERTQIVQRIYPGSK